MRSVLIPCLVASLGVSAALAACAKPFEAGDDTFDRGEASAAPPRTDGGNTGSSSGGSKNPRDGGETLLPDGGTDSDSGVPVEVPCDPTKGVGEVVDVPGLASASALRAEARLSLDELQIVFTQVRDRNAQQFVWDLYTASRASKTAPFENIQPVPTGQNAFTGALGLDGLSLYFTPHDATAANGLQVTTRTAGGAFTGATVLAGMPAYSYDPFVTNDGRLLFAAYPDHNPSTIQAAALSGASISGPQTIFAVAGMDVDYASLSIDGTELFYTTYLPPDGNAVFRRATRQGDGSYAGAAALAGLDEQNQEVTWVSADACRVYMTDWRGDLLRMGKRLP